MEKKWVNGEYIVVFVIDLLLSEKCFYEIWIFSIVWLKKLVHSLVTDSFF